MRLLVGPISAVGRLAGRADHVLSLISPDAEAPALTQPRTLLRFNDIAEQREGLIAPSAAMVETILTLRETPTLLIHCFAGVSRSTAAAYVLACAKRPAGEEQALATQLRSLSPEATPNVLMVALADVILDRGGAMTRAIAGIGRGVDAYEGAVIDWRLD
ncbi:tyrosine phosphatase family protein [Caulobacter sp. FWC2]|uniref:tyrosine phosphatase family protein n=1 Tax=Caulobacter sp. FWC2 TaxID=69664 RepID=UPI000C157241|nr:protein tyrosine phosphatase [Caulobacter sp. FWC2]PIB92114.1 protein tyrosine phosphatase [Caulobacter sp. FWC2]